MVRRNQNIEGKVPAKPSKEVQAVFGDRKIDNNARAVADAIIELLKFRGLEYNETELRRWCEFDFHRRQGKWAKVPGFVPPPLGGARIVEITRGYLKNWYKEHMKWHRMNS